MTPPESSSTVDDPALDQRDEEPLAEGSLAGIAFTGAVLGLAILFFARSFLIDSDGEIWPKVISGLLAGLAGLQLLRSLAARARAMVGPSDPLARDRIGRRAFTAAWVVAFAVVAKFTGFGVATLIFVPVYLVASGVRSPIWIAVIVTFTAAFLTILFGEFAGVPIWDARL